MERVSCIGYTIGHIASPHPGLVEFELSGPGRYWLVPVPGVRGGACSAILRTARLPGRGLHPPADVMALRKYIAGGRIARCCNLRQGFLLSVRLAALSGETEGEVVCRFDRHGLSLCLPDGRLILGQEGGRFGDGLSAEPFGHDAAGCEEGMHPEVDDGPLVRLFEEQKARVLRQMDAGIKKQRRLIENIGRDLEEFAGHEAVQRLGELVKSQLYKLRRGMDSVELEDWFSPGADGTVSLIRVPLDPLKDPGANLEAFFARAARYRRGLVSAARRLDEIRLVLDRLEAERAACAGLAFPAFSALPGQGPAPGRGGKPATVSLPAPKGGQKRALPWRTFVKEHVVILAGKSAASNAQLSLKVASGNDLWFHAKNWPGSHVLLRRKRKGHVFSEEEIHTAAVIALYYSEAKKFGREEVMLTEAKHVRRIPGAPLGAVSAAASRSLLVTLDDETVRAALASQE